MKTVTLRAETREQISKIETADILVGIPSFNNARTIGHVARAVQAGLVKYFPTHKAVIVNSDGGSSDGTRDVFANTASIDFESILIQHRMELISRIVFPYTGIPGKGSAFRSIFEIANALKVKACAVVDSDLRSITPEWIELLLKPVLQADIDFVAPLYHRHKYDGTITNSIVYPLTRALYGKRVRQPIGGDFGLSGKLAQFYLTRDVWETDVARFGIDIWMTTTAITNNFRIAQSFLGAKIHDARDPGSDLSDMLFQVVNATFNLMENYSDIWMPVRTSEAVKTFGFDFAVGLEHINVKTVRMMSAFRDGLINFREIWLEILGAGDFKELERLGEQRNSNYNFSLNLWTRIIYDYAIAFHARIMPAEHLIKSLTPLYLGKTASFIHTVKDMQEHEAEQEIEKLCVEFENNKEYLVTNWKRN